MLSLVTGAVMVTERGGTGRGGGYLASSGEGALAGAVIGEALKALEDAFYNKRNHFIHCACNH